MILKSPVKRAASRMMADKKGATAVEFAIVALPFFALLGAIMGELQQSDTVLVDLDLSFGTAGLDFNQDPAQTISQALADPDRLDDALLDRLLVKCGDRLSLFSAPATLESDWDFSAEAFETVLEKVRRQAPHIALDLPHEGRPYERLPEGARASVNDAIVRSGAAGFAHRAVDTLSGGEKARIHLARVLAAGAPLLLLDEPLNALDPRHQIDVMDGPQQMENAKAAFEYCLAHPQWSLSLQTHKWIGVD